MLKFLKYSDRLINFNFISDICLIKEGEYLEFPEITIDVIKVNLPHKIIVELKEVGSIENLNSIFECIIEEINNTDLNIIDLDKIMSGIKDGG